MRALVLMAVGFVIAWLVVTSTLVAYLSSAAPSNALWLSPRSAAALLKEAELELGAIRSRHFASPPATGAGREAHAAARDAALARVHANATLALASDQLSARAIRILGEVSYFRGDADRAAELMKQAARLSFRETLAVLYWLQNSLRTGRFTDALDAVDIVLRIEPSRLQAGIEAATRIAETEAGLPLLIERLRADPPWRESLLIGMSSYIADPRTPLRIMMALDAAGKPPRGGELTEYLRFLVARGHYDVARYAWLRFLPPDELSRVGLLYNGDFDRRPSGSPMDWVYKSSVGADVAIVPHGSEAADMALRVELGPGRVQLGEVRQQLFLPPGSFVLSGQTKGVLNGRRGLRWRLSCTERPSVVLGETAMLLGPQNTWRGFDVTFIVPETGCRSQILRLVHDARHSAEQLVTGVVWFDNLGIVRQ